MPITHDGVGSILDLIPPRSRIPQGRDQGWPTPTDVPPDFGAPIAPQTQPATMVDTYPEAGAYAPPQPVPPTAAPPPTSGPTQSGVILEDGKASLFNEVFLLTPSELSEIATILAQAYERIQAERVSAFRALHNLQPRSPRAPVQEMRGLPVGEAAAQETAWPVPKVRKGRKIRARKVQPVYRREEGGCATPSGPRPGSPHPDARASSNPNFALFEFEDVTTKSAEGGGDADGGQN